MNNPSSTVKPGGFPAFMKALWLYIAGILGVGIIYFLLTQIEEGIDVVMQVGEHFWPAFLSLFCVAAWVFLVWYTARMVGYAKDFASNTIPTALHRHIPRIIAFNGFVVIQTAIFALPSMCTTLLDGAGKGPVFFYLHGWWWQLIFIAAHNVLYYLLVRLWESKRKNTAGAKAAALALIVLYIAYIIYSLFMHAGLVGTYKRHPEWLSIIAFILFGFEICTVAFFIRRRQQVDKKVQQNTTGAQGQGRLIRRVAIKGHFKDAEAGYFVLLNIIAVVAVLLFGIAISWLAVANHFGAMGIVLLSVGLLVAFFNLISYISIRVRFNINFLLWIWAFAMGMLYDTYGVERVDSKAPTTFAQRPTSAAYFKSWLEKRQNNPAWADTANKYEVYIVLSNGGASRSGDWVSNFLCKMQDSVINTNDTFSQHLLCIAGASGGSIGNSVFYSLLKAQSEGALNNQPLYPHSDKFFAGDFLSYTLGHLAGPDFFRHLIPFLPWEDRATAIEDAMRNGPDDTLMRQLFDRPISKVFDTTGRLPALFINSTRVDDGKPAEVSSVQLPDNTQRIDILNLLDKCRADSTDGKGDIKLATAAMLSARFPYVSPAGCIRNNYFVDGGYFDNSGGGIVREFMDVVESEIEKAKKDSAKYPFLYHHWKQLHFTLIHILNGAVAVDTTDKKINPLVNDLFTPLITLAGIQDASTKVSDGSLDVYFKNINNDTTSQTIKINLYDTSFRCICSLKKEEPYPMSWVISGYNLERMRTRCNMAIKEHPELFTGRIRKAKAK